MTRSLVAFQIAIQPCQLCRDGGGTIDAGEMEEMVRGLFLMSGLEVAEEEVMTSTRAIIQAIDVDCDGDITMVTTNCNIEALT